jgi:hypothetical protein
MHPRLVEDDMRELGEPLLSIVDPAAPNDVLVLPVVRLPERRLVDPVGFFQDPLAEAVSVEHLHGAAGDAIGLAAEQST